MISGDRNHRLASLKQGTGEIQLCHGLLAVHKLSGIGYHSAICGTDCLMAKTYPKHGNFFPQSTDCFNHDTAVFRAAGTGGKDNAFGMKRADFFDGHLIIADHLKIGIDLTDQLVEIVGKTIVIIDQKYHRSASCASSRERSVAFALL